MKDRLAAARPESVARATTQQSTAATAATPRSRAGGLARFAGRNGAAAVLALVGLLTAGIAMAAAPLPQGPAVTRESAPAPAKRPAPRAPRTIAAVTAPPAVPVAITTFGQIGGVAMAADTFVMAPKASEYAAELSLDEQAKLRESLKYPNGMVPEQYLCDVGPDLLRCDAAAGYRKLNAAFHARFGRDLQMVDGYRSYEMQLATKAKWTARGKPYMAAKPGTSNHGWGLAADFIGPEATGGTVEHDWMVENGPRFGWEWPYWARGGPGYKWEPWHFDFVTDLTRLPHVPQGGDDGPDAGQQSPSESVALETESAPESSAPATTSESATSTPVTPTTSEPVVTSTTAPTESTGTSSSPTSTSADPTGASSTTGTSTSASTSDEPSPSASESTSPSESTSASASESASASSDPCASPSETTSGDPSGSVSASTSESASGSESATSPSTTATCPSATESGSATSAASVEPTS